MTRPPPQPKATLDRALHAHQARLTGSFSPTALTLAYADWSLHLLNSPGKLGELWENAVGKGLDYWTWVAQQTLDASDARLIEPLPQDRRFRDPAWQKWPFNLLSQGFLMHEQWWHYATTAIAGVSLHHQDLVSFAARQLLDMYSPSNFLWSNPEVLAATLEQRGDNLRRGFSHWLEDVRGTADSRRANGSRQYVVGRDIAATPGKIVYRNELIELIQYGPITNTVYQQPLLVVPAWIMKYYILDLSPHNSLVRYLVEHGHTVFMISWKNPDSNDRNFAMDDYLELGVLQALKAVSAICGQPAIHGMGYCLGGTLLTIAAAAMAREGDERLASLSLFASQMDFTEAGEIKVFVDESQLAFLEDVMWDRGYLDNKEMAGAFQLLRSNDLIWSRLVREYLLGDRGELTDLMAWNLDATRMPFRMHTEYLRSLYLHNDLAAGRYQVDGRPIAVSDIRVPVFMVGTVKDHVAPWKSVYKAHLLLDTEITFVLTSGGHNAGIVSEPGHPRRRYQLQNKQDADRYVDPDEWAQGVPFNEGSWWPAWQQWLIEHSGARQPPPLLGAPDAGYPPLEDAPGVYVLRD